MTVWETMIGQPAAVSTLTRAAAEGRGVVGGEVSVQRVLSPRLVDHRSPRVGALHRSQMLGSGSAVHGRAGWVWSVRRVSHNHGGKQC